MQPIFSKLPNFDAKEKKGHNPSLESERTVTGVITEHTLYVWIGAVLLSLLAVFVFCLLPFSNVKIDNHSFMPSLITILAIGHDILIVLGIIVIFRIELNIAVFTALLLLIGYSINDSLVLIFRIDQEYKKNRAPDVEHQTIDRAILDIRSRTLNTTLTTLCGLIPVFVVSANFIRPFLIVVIIGLIIGPYSSIFLVGSLLEIVLSETGKGEKVQKIPEPNI